MDAKTICNLGLGKIGGSRVNSLSPPKSAVERHCAEGYTVWRDDELKKRRWVFAITYADLTKVGPDVDVANDGRKYKFSLPNDCLRPLRDKHTEWEQRGQFIYSAYSAMKLAFIARKPENEFPSDFVNVLACRVARESVEFATQSNTKEQSAETKYLNAVDDAARSNSFIIGPEDIQVADENSEWISARWSA